MTTSTTETQETAQATATATEKPESPKKASARAQKPRVPPSKGKSGKKTTPAKKSAKAPKKAELAKAEVREGTKTEKVLELLKRPGGTTMKELMKATGWLPHSVRGFLSGTIGKKMRLAVTSVKGEDGNRSYSVKG